MPRARILDRAPDATLEWLLEPENPPVARLARATLLGTPAPADLPPANSYAPIAAILDAQRPDGSWDVPSRDYQKYRGSLWQIHLLGELHADGSDPRVQAGAAYAFSRQLADGSFSCNGRPSAAIPCLTANVARSLARLGYARDERVAAALDWCAALYRDTGALSCPAGASVYTINGYCHMLAPKLLLLLAEVPRDVWPDGAAELRDAAVSALRDKHVHLCLPAGSGEFFDAVYTAKPAERPGLRGRWLAERGVPSYGPKPGWLRFGYPLSYNSDLLEALAALMEIGEPRQPEFDEAIGVVEAAADGEMRWTMRNTLNGKMYADVERKGQPSKWLTLRALRVLDWAAGPDDRAPATARPFAPA